MEAMRSSCGENLRNIKKLRDYNDTYRLRIGNYRLFFTFEKSRNGIAPRIVFTRIARKDDTTYN